MSLALVGDRKCIQPQDLCINYPSWNVLSLHCSSFTGGIVLNKMYGEGESWGNWLLKEKLDKNV